MEHMHTYATFELVLVTCCSYTTQERFTAVGCLVDLRMAPASRYSYMFISKLQVDLLLGHHPKPLFYTTSFQEIWPHLLSQGHSFKTVDKILEEHSYTTRSGQTLMGHLCKTLLDNILGVTLLHIALAWYVCKILSVLEQRCRMTLL